MPENPEDRPDAGDDLDGDSRLPSPAVVVDEIGRGAAIEPARLKALSDPTDAILRRFVSLWPRIPAERRREVLAAMQRVAEDDATLDFHRVHLTALRDSDPATRMLAARGLQDEDRPEYMRLLAAQLRDDPVDSVRAEIAQVLGQYVIGLELGLMSDDDGETLIAALRDAIEDVDEPDEVRARALESLGALSDEATAELISEQYEVGSQRMRLAALRAMGRNASEGWLELLVYHFDDEDPEVRAVAAEAAGALLMDAAVDPLVLLAQEDKDEDVQVAAILALGEIANDEVERILTRWLSERREPHIQDALREALAGVHLMTAEFADEREEPPDFGEEPLG
jgi:HEAT repeat protein